MIISLVSVNVGKIEAIGLRRGKPVESGYRKKPVAGESVSVGLTGIDGDHQGDLVAHGGPDKAVYAYSADHFAFWTDAMKPASPYGPGSFAENLTLSGIDETEVLIGDVWRWGEAQLQICQPRYPCFKMALATERPKIVKRFLAEGRSGIYFRVLQPGSAPVTGPITVVKRDPHGLTVRDAAFAAYRTTDPGRLRELATHPELAARWKAILLRSAEVQDGQAT